MNEKTKLLLKSLRHGFLNIDPRKDNFCCLCEKKVGQWLPYKGGWKKAPAIMSKLSIIGSDLDNFSCRACDSHDRERHLWLYIQKTAIFHQLQNAAILHFAPEKHLSSRVEDAMPREYVKADLHPNAPDIQKVDMLNIPYEDNRFEFVIANHVLEHVPDYKKALAEIHRVLKPGGKAILQTPYSNVLSNTWEDNGINTAEQRLHSYGQEDHVRLFGVDIFEQFVNAGFTCCIKHHEEILADVPAQEYGINPKEPFMLFGK